MILEGKFDGAVNCAGGVHCGGGRKSCGVSAKIVRIGCRSFALPPYLQDVIETRSRTSSGAPQCPHSRIRRATISCFAGNCLMISAASDHGHRICRSSTVRDAGDARSQRTSPPRHRTCWRLGLIAITCHDRIFVVITALALVRTAYGLWM